MYYYEAQDNPRRPTLVWAGLAVAVGGLIWYARQEQKARAEAEAEAEEALAQLTAKLDQETWENTEAIPEGRPVDDEMLQTLNEWARQFRWGKRGVAIEKASWVWKTHRIDTPEGKVRVVKGKDRTATITSKDGGKAHEILYKASGRVVEL